MPAAMRGQCSRSAVGPRRSRPESGGARRTPSEDPGLSAERRGRPDTRCRAATRPPSRRHPRNRRAPSASVRASPERGEGGRAQPWGAADCPTARDCQPARAPRFRARRAAPRSAQSWRGLRGGPCAGSPPRRFLRQALHDSTRSFSKDQKRRSHMGQQMGRHAPARRIPWAAPPVCREDDEIHALPPDQSREPRSSVAAAGDDRAGRDARLRHTCANLIEVAARDALVAGDHALLEFEILSGQWTHPGQFRRRCDVSNQQVGFVGHRETGRDRQHAFGPSGAIERHHDSPVTNSAPVPAVAICGNEQQRAGHPIHELAGRARKRPLGSPVLAVAGRERSGPRRAARPSDRSAPRRAPE